MDRISELPDNIIHHIYSFLPTKDVIKTTTLSKSWPSRLLSYPNLDFDQSLFFHPPAADGNMEENKFVEYVDHTLLRFHLQNLNIEKFRLCVTNADSSLVDKWITLATYRSVNQVSLEMRPSDIFQIRYELTPEIVKCRSLRVLLLNNCDLTRCLSENVVVNLPCLKTLGLKQVKFYDQFMLNKLLKGCPSVSDFSFVQWYTHLKNISVLGLRKLKIVSLIPSYFTTTESIQIDAPILESLTVQGAFVNDEFLEHLLLKSPNLESLSLHGCYNLCRLNISSHHLKSLKIAKCPSLCNSSIDTPNLQSFEYIGNSPNAFSFVSAPCWCRIKLDSHSKFFSFPHLKRFLQGNKIKDLTLSIPYYAESTKGTSGTTPCCEVEHLSLCIGKSHPSNYETIIHALFSICRPKTLSVADSYHFIKFLCKKLMGNKVPKCCSKKERKCWKHKLKDVKIEGIEDCRELEALLIQRPIEWKTVLVAVPVLGNTDVYFSLNWISSDMT